MKREHAHKIPTGVYITGLVTGVGVFRLLASHFRNLASAPFGYVSVSLQAGRRPDHLLLGDPYACQEEWSKAQEWLTEMVARAKPKSSVFERKERGASDGLGAT